MSRIMTDNALRADDLHAYVDGRIERERMAAVAAEIAADPERRAAAEAYAEQRELLRAAADALDPGVTRLETERLARELARKLERRSRPAAWTGLRRLAMAASLVAAGWFGHAAWDRTVDPLPGYVAEAAGAHAVFGEDQVHPAEFTTAELAQVRAWLAAKIGRDVRAPDLKAIGVHLIGARLLGTKEGALAQYIYEDGTGHRMTLVVAPLTGDAAGRALVVRAAPEGRVAYWSDGRAGYALVAKTSDEQLRALWAEIGPTLERG